MRAAHHSDGSGDGLLSCQIRLGLTVRTCKPSNRGWSIPPIVLKLQADSFGRHLFNVFTRKKDMNFIIWLIVGGLVGWVASIIMKSPEGIVMNVVVGIVGAMLGGWLISPLLGVGTINQNNFSLPGLLVSLVGAVILLAIVNIFRRGRTR